MAALKIIYCLTRKAGLSREESQKYWLNTHAVLVNKAAGVTAIKRYVQSHTLDHPMGKALQDSRGMKDVYDGIAEIWWDSAEAVQAALATTEGQNSMSQLLDDEKKFIDFDRSTIFLTEEHQIC